MCIFDLVAIEATRSLALYTERRCHSDGWETLCYSYVVRSLSRFRFSVQNIRDRFANGTSYFPSILYDSRSEITFNSIVITVVIDHTVIIII